MLFKALSAAVYGIDANLIDVEVDFSGIKTDQDHFHTVGLPDAAVRESRDRVRAAIKNSGYRFRPRTSPSTSRPPTQERRLRLRSAHRHRHSRRLRRAAASATSASFFLSANSDSTAACAPSPACCPSPSLAREQRNPQSHSSRSQCRRSCSRRGRECLSRRRRYSMCVELLNAAAIGGIQREPFRVADDAAARRAAAFPRRLRRCARPADRQARSRSRRRRQSQHPHDRPARLRQNHARQAPAVDPRAAHL